MNVSSKDTDWEENKTTKEWSQINFKRWQAKKRDVEKGVEKEDRYISGMRDRERGRGKIAG